MGKNRAQCLIVREHKILCVRHSQDGREYYCLPGGGIEDGETPKQAAKRELLEECGVTGKNLRLLAKVMHKGHYNYTFSAEIGKQEPALGYDPEFPEEPVLVGVRWCTLGELSERDRAYLWSAGLIACPEFADELDGWGEDISYPAKRPD